MVPPHPASATAVAAATLSPDGGGGVKSNIYFPLAPTGRGARGEGGKPQRRSAPIFLTASNALPGFEELSHRKKLTSEIDDGR